MKNIKKLTSYILLFALVIATFPAISLGDILITEDITAEQDLRFSTISDTQKASVQVPIQPNYKNVKVISSEADNGRVESTSINTNAVTVNLIGGTPSSQPVAKTIIHTDTIDIDDKIADSNNIISIPVNSECDSITAITGVSSADGSLLSASGIGTTTLKVLVDPKKGKDGYDYNSTSDKCITISAPSNNRNKAYAATATVTPYKSAYVNEIDKNGNTFTIDTSNKEAGVIAVNFTEGKVSRKINTNLAYSCPKRWVDRHLNLDIDTPDGNGGRKKVKINPMDLPNITPDKFIETNTYAKPSNVDFWGYYIGQAPGNNNVSYPTGENNLFLCYDKLGLSGVGSKTFRASDFIKYNVKGNSSISVIYDIISTGIKTTGNAEYKAPRESQSALNPGESQDKFYDPLYLGELKTKVYHWYYWAGIDTWGMFGGLYYYPYTTVVHYLAYNPAKLYSGSVTYEYQEQQIIPGGKYNYNGKIRIRYTTTQTILDKPPTTPGGVIATAAKVINGPSSDDYTPPEQIRYRYYYNKNNVWTYLGESTGIKEYNWNPSALGLDLLNLKVGVIAVDNRNQTSGRAENDPNASINITGTLSKTIVQPGETLDIYAETDSSPECYEVGYNIENSYGSGLMEKNGKKPYEVNIYTTSGYFYIAEDNDRPFTDNVTNVEHIKADGTRENYTTKNDYERTSGQPYVCSSEGTIIIPDLNNKGFRASTSGGSIVNEEGFNYYAELARTGEILYGYEVYPYEYICHNYNGGAYNINPYSKAVNSQFGLLGYYTFYSTDDSKGSLYYSYYKRPDNWLHNYHENIHVKGVYAHAQIWNQRVSLPYWNLPIAITYSGNKYNVYQNGSFIAQVTADRTMEGFVPGIPSFRSRRYEENVNENKTYSEIGMNSGKTIITDRVWSLDQINTFMSGAYGDNYHIANPELFRQNTNDGKDYSSYITYGGIRRNGKPHPEKLYDYLPGKLVWKKTIALPSNITEGTHTITLTAKNGLQASITLTFFVNIPEFLNPKGSIPYYVYQGKTYTATAKSSKKASTMDLIVFGNSYPMKYIGIDNSDADYPGGAKCWTYNITIPISADYGSYDQLGGTRRMAEFKASSASGRTESDYQPFNVLLSLSPIGDIPDSIETKTNFKARCTTNAAATSVTVTIDPSPGASPYSMVMVSNDGSHKVWETGNLQYPEGLAGASGRLATGIFTARGPSNSVETDTDTGMLYEKIEISKVELRRYQYENGDKNKPIVETLCRSLSTRAADSAGFLMAGWEMGLKIITKGYIDRIEFDFIGPSIEGEADSSIKMLDKLTKKFEWENPVNRGKTPFTFSSLQELEKHYIFPKRFEKAFKLLSSNDNIFTAYYLIPYGTKQTLHSWYTLRQESQDAFEIDKSRLLERIKDPFVLRLKAYSGTRSIVKDIKLDIFERWDTLLNRDIRSYIDNPGDHDPVDKNYWETTTYVEH
ncbi:MAG: hypothetical protein ACM3UU_00620 [Ignavibacteriales bacterium]